MKSVPNSIISIITHNGIGEHLEYVQRVQLWPTSYARTKKRKEKKTKSNQNSQDALGIEKCQFYVVHGAYEVYYILCMYDEHRAACSLCPATANISYFESTREQISSDFGILVDNTNK